MEKLSYQEKIQKGKDYEKFIYEHYKQCGYKVYDNGKINGKKDGGIDLIAIKEKEIIFIQCKNWKENTRYKIEHKDIKTFETDINNYLEKNPIFKTETYTKKTRYIVSGDILHTSALKYIKEKEYIDYEIIRIK